MSESRSKNSKRNIISGLLKQSITLLLGFATRTIVLFFLGAAYQGLNGLLNSVLQMLSLTDLGFSTAVIYILYKPIAENDTESICGIVNFLKKVYRLVGVIILILGLILLPFLKFFIKDEIPNDINIYILYCIYLFNAVISYFSFAYKNSVLSAMQREDIVSNVYSFSAIFVKVLQIILLLLFRNYYLFIIVIPIGTILNNILVEIESRRRFPQIIPSGTMSKEQKGVFSKQIKGIYIGKLSDVARNSFDNIVIASFLGLTAVAIYDNYYYIYNALYGFMAIIIHAIMASAGNSIVTESREKNFNDMLNINFLFMMIVGWCSICMFCLYQPFMLFWMKGNTNLLLSDSNMGLFCFYFYAINMTYVRSIYLDGFGLFFECRFWCIGEAVSNLLLNVLLCKVFGITGVIVATIITIIFFNFYGRSEVLFSHYFRSGKGKFYFEHIVFLLITIVIAVLSKFICNHFVFDTIVQLIFNLFVCCLTSFAVYFIVFRNSSRFKNAISFLKKVIHAKR